LLIEYINFLSDDFIDDLTVMSNTLANRDLETIYDLLYDKVEEIKEALLNYNQSTPGAVKDNYNDQVKLYFSELNTLLRQFDQIAIATTTEISQILTSRTSVKYELISKQMEINSSLQTLKDDVVESLELIDATLTEVRNIFETRIDNIATLPS